MTASGTTSFTRSGDYLILANGTLRGAAIEERVAAAASAGYDGIGLSLSSYRRLMSAGWTPQRLKAVLDAHGLQLAEIEAGFAVDHAPPPDHSDLPDRTYLDPASEALAFSIADTFGSRHIQVLGGLGPIQHDVVERFAGLCDRAARYNQMVALEFLPTTNIPDLQTASDIVQRAGRENGGLCIDSWHCFRGSTTHDQLRQLDGGRVVMIQINDGYLPGATDLPYLIDTTTNRMYPGTGDFQLSRLLTTLWDQGVNAPISVEVISEALDQRPASEVAARSAESTRAVIANSRT